MNWSYMPVCRWPNFKLTWTEIWLCVFQIRKGTPGFESVQHTYAMYLLGKYGVQLLLFIAGAVRSTSCNEKRDLWPLQEWRNFRCISVIFRHGGHNVQISFALFAKLSAHSRSLWCAQWKPQQAQVTVQYRQHCLHKMKPLVGNDVMHRH